MKNLLDLINDENGQGMAEYALILVLVVVVIIIAVNALGVTVRDNMNNSVGRI